MGFGDSDVPRFLPDKMIVLLVFCLITTINGYSWMMFDPAVRDLEELFSPNFTKNSYRLLAAWQPIIYLFVAYPITRMIVQRDGLRRVMQLGSFFELLGAALKLISCYDPKSMLSLYLLHFGQILSATVSPIAIGGPSHLSSVWFPDHQRTRATGACVLFNDVGIALAYLVIPTIVSQFGYAYVVLLEVVLASVSILLTHTCLPETPHRRKAVNSEEEEVGVSVLKETKGFLGLPACSILCIVYAWAAGGYVAWNSMFDDLLGEMWEDTFIGFADFSATCAFVLGGFFSSALADSHLHHKMKEMLIVACAGSVAASAIITLSTPSVFGENIIIDGGKIWFLAIASVCGMFNGAAAPLFYELGAELSYPHQRRRVWQRSFLLRERWGASHLSSRWAFDHVSPNEFGLLQWDACCDLIVALCEGRVPADSRASHRRVRGPDVAG